MRILLVSLIAGLAMMAPGAVQSKNIALRSVSLAAGLEARIGVVGRNASGNYVSIAMQIENKGRHPVQIFMVGPAPYAADNAGATYRFDRFSGATRCESLVPSAAASCIGHSGNDRYTAPLEVFTQIDPGTLASMTFGLARRNGSKGSLLSFAATFAYRIVDDPRRDERASDEQRRKSIKTMSISFPSFPIN